MSAGIDKGQFGLVYGHKILSKNSNQIFYYDQKVRLQQALINIGIFLLVNVYICNTGQNCLGKTENLFLSKPLLPAPNQCCSQSFCFSKTKLGQIQY